MPHLLFTDKVTPLTAHIYLISLLQSYLSCDFSQLCLIDLAKSSAASSAGFSSTASSTSSQTLSHLSNCCVLAVYQLKQFEFMKYQYVLLILNNVISLVHSIVTLYSTSVEYQASIFSQSQQTHVKISQSDLDYSISWLLTKSSLTKTIHCFKEKSNILLQNSVFKMWISFQAPNNLNKSDSNQSNSFKISHRLCWFIASASNKLNLFTALLSPQLDQSHE